MYACTFNRLITLTLEIVMKTEVVQYKELVDQRVLEQKRIDLNRLSLRSVILLL